MTSLQTEASPRTTVPLVESGQLFWRYFADTGVSYFKWVYGGWFLFTIAYYVFRLFQWLWSRGNFVGFAGAIALLSAVIFGAYWVWRTRAVQSSAKPQL